MPAYRLTESLLSEFGGPVVCLDARAVGRRFRLHETRPGAELNERVTRASVSADDISSETTSDIDNPETAVTIVRIDGPIEQRAEYHECGGFSDGHDAIAERMIAGLEVGNVVMIVDSPGGAAAGAQEAIRRVLEAKEKYGRTVFAVADETIASGAFWWVASVADEVYGPEAMRIGSIGARSGHASEAAALKKAGIEVTYFTWPNDGKVAFAPEFPLTEEGRRRGERDIKIIGETFASAVERARGLSRKDIVRLGADVLTGQAAVDAGLVDGIASIEDVIGFALALAGEDKETDMSGIAQPARAVASAAPAVRLEDEKKEDEKDKKDEAEDEKKEDETKEESDEKKDEAEDEKKDDETEDDEDEEYAEEEYEDEKKKDEKKEESKTSLSAILGLRDGASQPAIKSAVLAYVKLGKAVMTATSTNGPNAALGAFQTIVDDAAQALALKTENRSLKRAERDRERKSLLLKLASANVAGYRRGDLFVDSVDEKTGAKTTAIAPAFAEMKLATLRGLVSSKLASATASPRTPFDPSEEKVQEAAKKVSVDAAKSTEAVKLAGSYSTAPTDQLARTYAALVAQGAIQS